MLFTDFKVCPNLSAATFWDLGSSVLISQHTPTKVEWFKDRKCSFLLISVLKNRALE